MLRSPRNVSALRLLAGLLLGAFVAVAGCETNAQTGALGGAGIGALAGQAIGGDTKSTLIGAGVGTGVGYMIGNEKDKKEARQMSEQSRQTSPAYDHNQDGPLQNTRWQVVSLVPADAVKPYASKIVEFRPSSRVVTTTTASDGSVMVSDEHYRVVGNTLIVNKPGYLINAQFAIDGQQLIVTAEQFRAVLKRMP